MRRPRPSAVVAFGGFTAAPAALAARLSGVPVALHEANRVPGRATRVLSRLARRVYLPPGISLAGTNEQHCRHAALPVRAEIARRPRAEACAQFGLDPAKKILVVLGGSQGASALNSWVRRELVEFAAANVQVCCVTGPGKTAGLADGPGAPVFLEFCDDMAALLSAADVAVSRAGAGTLAELARIGTPAILVPYPHAADNHQQANASWFASEGGGYVLAQDNLASLGVRTRDLLADEVQLAKIRAALRILDRPAALGMMIDDLENLHQPPPGPVAMQFTLA